MREIEPFYKGFGRRIQSLRTEKGMSQEELGQRLTPKVTRASIANIESGKQRVLAHTLLQLADALNVGFSEIVPIPQITPPQSIRDTVENEMAQKLNLPQKKIKSLVAQMKSSNDRKNL